ncbi:MAG: hypothetical protein JSV03_12110 [Planctomycetota bacterium]|nr:MAG: hypothetical protein JSV03_12110 [Planctomycetota bacterium]
MIRLVSILLLSMIILSLSACRQDSESPPRLLTDGAKYSLPICLSDMPNDSKFVGPVGEARSVSIPADTEADRGPAKTEFTINDSSAEAVVQSYADMIAGAHTDLWPEIVVPEQQEFAGILAELFNASQDLRQAMEEKFPGHAFKLPAGASLEMPKITIVSVEVVTDQEATASIKIGDLPQTIDFNVMQTDDGWRIEDPTIKKVYSNDQVVTYNIKLIDVLQNLTTRVEADEFADAQAVMQEVLQVMSQIAQQKTDMSDDADATIDDSQKSVEPERKPRPQRPKSEIESQMDVAPGPGFLPRG